ncbi:MAG: DNA cytosine methyltransferase [Terriglobia bacterium]
MLQKVYQAEESEKAPLFSSVSNEVIEKPTPACIPFKFVDLFAGIGGFRIALNKLRGECVFFDRVDKYN